MRKWETVSERKREKEKGRVTMIDWVSIVRHSSQRFSSYVNGVPNKVRQKRRKRHREEQEAGLALRRQHQASQLSLGSCTCDSLSNLVSVTEDDDNQSGNNTPLGHSPGCSSLLAAGGVGGGGRTTGAAATASRQPQYINPNCAVHGRNSVSCISSLELHSYRAKKRQSESYSFVLFY